MIAFFKRRLAPYYGNRMHVVAYGKSDTTRVAQAMGPVTVSVKGDTVKVDSVTVRTGFVAGGDTTWTDTTRVGGSITRDQITKSFPGYIPGLRGKIGEKFDEVVEATVGSDKKKKKK